MAESCHSKQFAVLAFDPGVTTGYAVAEVDVEAGYKVVGYGEHSGTLGGLWAMLEGISPLYIVAESFEYRNEKRYGTVLQSRNVLGVLELWCEIRNRQLDLQSASQGKTYFTNDKLKRLDLYFTGQGHARDAVRHLLQWFTFGRGYQWNQK